MIGAIDGYDYELPKKGCQSGQPRLDAEHQLFFVKSDNRFI